AADGDGAFEDVEGLVVAAVNVHGGAAAGLGLDYRQAAAGGEARGLHGRIGAGNAFTGGEAVAARAVLVRDVRHAGLSCLNLPGVNWEGSGDPECPAVGT